MTEKRRIWELDAFRGVCILGMVVVHALYDLVVQYHVLPWQLPQAFYLLQKWGGVLFFLLSGICATLGSRSVRRGIVVFACGMLVTAVTVGLYLLRMFDESIMIWFGVLHCLGVCMLLWPLLKRMPLWGLVLAGGLAVTAGLLLEHAAPVPFPWLIPLGIPCDGFVSMDYFPLLPNLGYFLLGAVLGRTVYARKQTRFPHVRAEWAPLRALRFCGRHSLEIYLLHQPLLAAVCTLLQKRI